ncbi:prepilin peptidase [Ligilactobacillus saerimneri]|uniref:prepilin peptidase n=1 Tax=Ligilactobacillus saerimneri TaxID=228229 RepID=UPI0039C20095
MLTSDCFSYLSCKGGINLFIYYLIFFTLGTCLCSFSQCLGWRLAQNNNLTHQHRSICDNCQSPLSFQQLIPVWGSIWGPSCAQCHYHPSIWKGILEFLAGIYCSIITYIFPLDQAMVLIAYFTWANILLFEDYYEQAVSFFLFGSRLLILILYSFCFCHHFSFPDQPAIILILILTSCCLSQLLGWADFLLILFWILTWGSTLTCLNLLLASSCGLLYYLFIEDDKKSLAFFPCFFPGNFILLLFFPFY